jgi:hypothetical protein
LRQNSPASCAPPWNGSLDLSSPAALDELFIPIVTVPEGTAQIANLGLVSESGTEYLLAPGASGWTSRSSTDGSLELRSLDWYEGAVNTAVENQPYWTDLDPAAMDDVVGVAASVTWAPAAGGGGVHVAAIGIAAGSIHSLIDEMPITENGLVILPADDDTVLWFSSGAAGFIGPTENRRLVQEPSGREALIGASLRKWHAEGEPLGVPLRLNQDGEQWWLMFLGPETQGGRREIGMLIPRGDLSARLFSVTSPFTYALLAIVGVGVLALARLAFGYRWQLIRKARTEGHATDSEERLRALISAGESERLEFKSTLRWKLKTNKPGREIEQAWLKTVVAFMNSRGGTLLIGVHDDGSVEGIGTDGFRNEDKYLLHFNNLINKHVGLEFARYLSFALRPLADAKIFVVDCRPSKEPVFLKIDEEELFYVRMGPASRKLSLGKTLEYLRGKRGGGRLRRPQ